MLKLVWDAENDRHISARHGVTREEVEEAINGDTLVRGRALTNGEHRTALLGRTETGRVLLVVLTDIRPGVVRAVTAFPAKRKLRALYNQYLGGKK